MPLSDALVTLDNVSLSFKNNAGPVEILKDVSLYITSGETISLIGPSGSGKSSLLMLMGGLERPTAGKIVIDGADITKMGEDDLANFRRGRIGVVFQSFHLIPTMTALENVCTPLEIAGAADVLSTAQKMLDRVGLSHRQDHYPHHMSGGEQQRVAIARALAIEPAIILADEPTGNLDQDTGEKVIDLLFDLQKETQSTLVMVTHDPALAAKCNRSYRLINATTQEVGA